MLKLKHYWINVEVSSYVEQRSRRRVFGRVSGAALNISEEAEVLWWPIPGVRRARHAHTTLSTVLLLPLFNFTRSRLAR